MHFDPERHLRVTRHCGGDTAVLFVHGIQGSPCQFRFLTDELNANVSYDNLVLPGHGGCPRDFRKSGMEEWQNAVNQAAIALTERYQKVYYVGHSMGCLLGLRAVLSGPVRFDGMMLLACPLKLHFTLNYLKRNHLSLLISETNDPYLLAAQEANSVSAKTPLAYLGCLRPYFQLLRLIRKTNRELAPLSCQVCAFHADGDEIVGKRSLDILKNAGASGLVLLESGHNYFPEPSKEMMIRALREMIGS